MLCCPFSFDLLKSSAALLCSQLYDSLYCACKYANFVPVTCSLKEEIYNPSTGRLSNEVINTCSCNYLGLLVAQRHAIKPVKIVVAVCCHCSTCGVELRTASIVHISLGCLILYVISVIFIL